METIKINDLACNDLWVVYDTKRCTLCGSVAAEATPKVSGANHSRTLKPGTENQVQRHSGHGPEHPNTFAADAACARGSGQRHPLQRNPVHASRGVPAAPLPA
jgi:hypothetical protein